jgi:hypothetical protein
MLDTFDPSVLSTFFENVDLSTSSSLASLFSFFQGISAWREGQRKGHQNDNLDAYIDFLRRQEHQVLVDSILQNRQAFQELFDRMESAVVAAINTLNQDQQRRHEERQDLQIRPDRIAIRQNVRFTAEIYQQIPEWQPCHLRGSFDFINKNQSAITIRNARITVSHGQDTFVAQLVGQQANTKIEANGHTATLFFQSVQMILWKLGELYTPVELTLEVLQEEAPLEFTFIDGKMQPRVSVL